MDMVVRMQLIQFLVKLLFKKNILALTVKFVNDMAKLRSENKAGEGPREGFLGIHFFSIWRPPGR